ncbi:hypothetical protein [Exiguobacterium sp.]|uniref:hypothetical protein n=1 Tax=Exiguobacterium sp. TaxID=44751 RepID=UPI0028A93175|nr:hypothetical protein [Exiguobacterium sp.]
MTKNTNTDTCLETVLSKAFSDLKEYHLLKDSGAALEEVAISEQQYIDSNILLVQTANSLKGSDPSNDVAARLILGLEHAESIGRLEEAITLLEKVFGDESSSEEGLDERSTGSHFDH